MGACAFLGEQRSSSLQYFFSFLRRPSIFCSFYPVKMFVEGLCWTQTAERQASRMRRLYLEAVLRQQVEFFDTSGPASQGTTFRVISTISDDADTIQDFLAEKVPISTCVHAGPGRAEPLNLSSRFSCPTSWQTLRSSSARWPWPSSSRGG